MAANAEVTVRRTAEVMIPKRYIIEAIYAWARERGHLPAVIVNSHVLFGLDEGGDINAAIVTFEEPPHA